MAANLSRQLRFDLQALLGRVMFRCFRTFLEILEKGQARLQLENNTSHLGFVYVGNVASAYMQLALAMVREEKEPLHLQKVAGEAILITNDQLVLFWDY